MAYKGEEFIKTKDGVDAPDGFHYMPNGELMNSADHIAVYGYIEKKIKSVVVDSGDINPTGGTKRVLITGDRGFVFSVEVYEGDRASYYNFKTQTWTAASYKQTNVQGVSGNYSTNIVFPQQSSLKTFTINVHAETVDNIRTRHIDFDEVRNEDGSVNQNMSTGSNSNIITRVIYQDVIKSLGISTFAASQNYASTGTTNGAVSSNRMILDQNATDSNVVRIGDLISCTGILAALGVLVTKINPDGDNIYEIEMSASDTVGDGVTVTFTTPFQGTTPNIASTTGSQAIDVVSQSSGTYPFSITISSVAGRGFGVLRLPTVEDLCAVNTVTFGAAASAIEGEDVSGSTYYRWPVTNIANIAGGMELDPSRSSTGANTTTPAIISDYRVNKTLQRIDKGNKYYTDFKDYTEKDIFISGVDDVGNVATVIDRNGRVTARAGNLTFGTKQADALKSDSGVVIIARGASGIEDATGMGVKVSGVTLTSTQVSTTTTAASSASTTIAVTDATKVIVGQTVRSAGINPTLANPTVVSKSTATGAANIVVSSVQTLEDGATLYFDGFSTEILVEGKIHITNMPIVDTTLYFDIERFLTAS